MGQKSSCALFSRTKNKSTIGMFVPFSWFLLLFQSFYLSLQSLSLLKNTYKVDKRVALMEEEEDDDEEGGTRTLSGRFFFFWWFSQRQHQNFNEPSFVVM